MHENLLCGRMHTCNGVRACRMLEMKLGGMLPTTTSSADAVGSGITCMIELLLEHGANPHQQCRGVSPLHLAKLLGKSRLVRIFLLYESQHNLAATGKGTAATETARDDDRAPEFQSLLSHLQWWESVKVNDRLFFMDDECEVMARSDLHADIRMVETRVNHFAISYKQLREIPVTAARLEAALVADKPEPPEQTVVMSVSLGDIEAPAPNDLDDVVFPCPPLVETDALNYEVCVKINIRHHPFTPPIYICTGVPQSSSVRCCAH